MGVIEGETKRCSKCGEAKEFRLFFPSARFPDGKRKECRECSRGKTDSEVALRASNNRASLLRTKYKMTVGEYGRMWRDQKGRCALCGEAQGDNGPNLGVDHDHSCCDTGETCGECVRSLLCNKCNLRLGWYETTKEFHHRFDAYLEEHEAKRNNDISRAV